MLQLSRNFSSDRLVEFFQAISQTTAITLRGSRQAVEKTRPLYLEYHGVTE